jgi:predicted DNA-binding transcriptional regulator AlpA
MTPPLTARTRREKPPIESRRWLDAGEVAGLIGCSRSTVQRFSNGQVPGVPRLPFVPRGAKSRVWLKETVEEWLRRVQG